MAGDKFSTSPSTQPEQLQGFRFPHRVFLYPCTQQSCFSKWNTARADENSTVSEWIIISICQLVIKAHDFTPKAFPWISKLLESSNCTEASLPILKKDNVCHWQWQRKAGRHELCLPQKVTGWRKTTQLTSTVPLQALYFLKIKTLDQILGGGLDLGFF